MNFKNSDISRVVEKTSAEGAFLAAAIGDALGWPHEARARRAGGTQTSSSIDFENWEKRAGGRFMPYEEKIGRGEYSDDTQLIVATARSILSAKDWWRHFGFVELPFWTTYERGGGGATRRAVTQLTNGVLPWETNKKIDVAKYFEAGGNGVAMRILPHCIVGAADPNFSNVASAIMANGVCTHGHPRALLGALAYGYGLWSAFRHSGTLGYGILIENTISAFNEWAYIPELTNYWDTWHKNTAHLRNYKQIWGETAEEMRDLLSTARDGISQGALTIDEDILQKLGCFNPKINGSGTVAAAAALFLASRHAVNPMVGVIRAAQAHGTDTDTIASMTGALLGAFSGTSWLNDFKNTVQDSKFLSTLAGDLLKVDKEGTPSSSVERLNKEKMDSFMVSLGSIQDGGTINLPNGLGGQKYRWDGINLKSKNLDSVAFRVVTADGQTLFLKKVSKSNSHKPVHDDLFQTDQMPIATRIGITIVVSDLEQSRKFYEEALGLLLSKVTPKSLNFGGVLGLRLGNRTSIADTDIFLFVEVPNIDEAYKQVKVADAHILKDLGATKSGRRYFVCRDPNSYIVEVYQAQ